MKTKLKFGCGSWGPFVLGGWGGGGVGVGVGGGGGGGGGPIWVPFVVWGPFGSQFGTHFLFGAHLGPNLGPICCLGPIWVPIWDPFIVWGPFGSHLGPIWHIFGPFWLMGLAHGLFCPILPYFAKIHPACSASERSSRLITNQELILLKVLATR